MEDTPSEMTINVAPMEEKDDHQIVTLVEASDLNPNEGIIQIFHTVEEPDTIQVRLLFFFLMIKVIKKFFYAKFCV